MKVIESYKGNYLVSLDGKVYNSKGLCMSQKNDSKGFYKMINLSFQGKKKMFLVHRLVALAYIPIIKGKEQVNHKDGNKKNNHADNLEWVTPAENLKHSYHVLGNKHKPCMLGKFGADHNKSKRVHLLNPDGEYTSFGSGLEAKRKIGVDNTCFTYASRVGLPYTFKKGKLKNWTMISSNPHMEIAR